MPRSILLASCAFVCAGAVPLAAQDAPPRVAVDIAPIHGLVAQVMAGVGDPDLVIPPGATPHGYSMRPSEARMLEAADLIIWAGPTLTPWLQAPIESLAGGAHQLRLLEVEGNVALSFRDGVAFEAHDHDHEGHDHEEHDHEEHDHEDHDHEAHDHEAHDHEGHDHEGHDHEGHDHEEHDHEEHDHEAHDHEDDHASDHDDHGHDHSGIDPHAWLDPVNAQLWLSVIAGELARIDPDNAALYSENAATAQAALDVQAADVADRMAALSGRFVVFHDAYHYFEARFGIEAAGAISLSDAAPPSPQRMAEIRDLVVDQDITCVFVEPQFNRGIVDAVFDGSDIRITQIDPLGAALTPGATLYGELLEGMADAFEACLGDG